MMLILLLSLIVASVSVASAQSSFYKAQTITVIADANAGSTYDCMCASSQGTWPSAFRKSSNE